MEKEKKDSIAQYLFVYVDKNNKINNIITDMRYLIDSRESVMNLIAEINEVTRGNFKALVNIIKLCDLKPTKKTTRRKKNESKIV